MPRSALTGSRIRARRLDLGLRQVDLARSCGISASYLNLIEHNRRRIGGKLLVDIARALGMEVSVLSQGADVALIEELRSAAESAGISEAADRAEELAGRLPDWARVLTELSRRVSELEAALMWLFRAIGRVDELSGVVAAILQRRLDHRRELGSLLGVDDGARLDRLASATLGRQQVIADLARDVRFHFFDEPPIEVVR